MKRNGFYLIFFVFLAAVFPVFFSHAQEKNAPVTLSYLNANLPDTINLKVNSETYPLNKADILKWVSETSSLTYSPRYYSEIENPRFCQRIKSIGCLLEFRSGDSRHIKKESLMTLDENAVKNYVSTLAQKTDHDPEDAKLAMDSGKASVFSLGSKGLTLDQEKSSQIITDYLKNGDYKNTTVELPYTEKDPEIANVDSIDNMGITTLIGEGQSNFRGSPKNRVYNINVATKKYNGVLIKPGQEFSFVGILGEVDGKHGYLPELVIKKDKTEPEFGGGICQVSTTAYRAALNAGLKITARRNHAYPVSYYNPQGMDATVYVPRPDLRFLNNTPGYILIQTKIVGTILTFDFYGTNDGRKVEINGPTIVERNPDGSMKTTLTEKVWDASGKLIIDDDLNSSYDSPDKYPHPSTTADVLTTKPNGWSDNEWSKYKKKHNLP